MPQSVHTYSQIIAKSLLKNTHAVCAEVTHVISSNEHSDHFPVIVEINAL